MLREDFKLSNEKTSESTASSDSGVNVEDATKDEQQKCSPEIEITIENERTKSDTIKNSENCKIDSIKDDNERHSSISTNSDRSHHISIVSLDDDAESSVIDSDSDFEDVPEQFIQKLGQHTTEADRNGLIMINQQLGNEGTCIREGPSASKTQIGSIAVQNSTDITFGNKTFYQGPVTIKQFLVENKKLRKLEGNENGGFETDESKPTANGDLQKKPQLSRLEYLREKYKLNTKPVLAGIITVLVSLIVCTITLVTWQLWPVPSRENPENEILRLISRDEWSAQPPREPLTSFNHTVRNVIIAHTVTEGCTITSTCIFRVHLIQSLHMQQEDIFVDIGYNFLVGGDGAAYEGRGFDKVGAHTPGFNSKSICIAFIGTFIRAKPNEKQLRAAQLLLKEGVRQKKLDPDYKLFGHRQLMSTESPGEALYEIIKTWPHWSEEI